jgi:hydroxymethylglutaryl-CoA lyase
MVALTPTLRRSLLRRLQLRNIRGLATATDAHQQSFDNRVKIVEVGPRDGLQNEKKSIPVATKIELIEKLAKTGLTTIEAGSFVSPKWVPQVRQPRRLPSVHPSSR